MSLDWLGSKSSLFICFLVWKRKPINKIARKTRDDPWKIVFLCFAVLWFFAPQLHA